MDDSDVEFEDEWEVVGGEAAAPHGGEGSGGGAEEDEAEAATAGGASGFDGGDITITLDGERFGID
jgi:hypothetical protein